MAQLLECFKRILDKARGINGKRGNGDRQFFRGDQSTSIKPSILFATF